MVLFTSGAVQIKWKVTEQIKKPHIDAGIDWMEMRSIKAEQYRWHLELGIKKMSKQHKINQSAHLGLKGKYSSSPTICKFFMVGIWPSGFANPWLAAALCDLLIISSDISKEMSSWIPPVRAWDPSYHPQNSSRLQMWPKVHAFISRVVCDGTDRLHIIQNIKYLVVSLPRPCTNRRTWSKAPPRFNALGNVRLQS